MSDKFSISPTEIQRLDGSNVRTQPDFVVVEEPLEIKLVMGQILVDDSNADTLSTPRAESETKSNAESQATSPIEKPLPGVRQDSLLAGGESLADPQHQRHMLQLGLLLHVLTDSWGGRSAC